MPSRDGRKKYEGRAMFPALAALPVRDTVALFAMTFLYSTAPATLTSKELVTKAFEVADVFEEQSTALWAMYAKRRRS